MRRPITLYVNHFTSPSTIRQGELDECLRRNLANDAIDRVVVIAQSSDSPPPGIQSEKLVWIPTDCQKDPYQRPTFRRFFALANWMVRSPYELSMVANSDLYYDDSLELLTPVDLEGSCMALARWDFVNGEPQMLCTDNAQDTWIFQGAIRPLLNIDFPMGVYGCDNRLAFELAHADYKVVNPCYSIRAYHLHPSGVRFNGSGLGGPAEVVSQTNLRDCGLPRLSKSRTGCIGFSLFGSEARYNVGAVENARLARHLYAGWTVRFYVDSTVPAETIAQLRSLECEIVLMPESRGKSGAFWRFLVADAKGYAHWLVRDADSRLNYRERRAVDEWIESGAPFHVMRDHLGHQRPIIGFGFGGVCGVIPDMTERVERWPWKENYGNDEDFLEGEIWPLVKDVALVHSSVAEIYDGNVRPFPTPRENFRFVGERCFEDEHWSHEDRRCLIATEAAKIISQDKS